MRETNRFFPLRGRHSLVLALLLCLTAQAGVSGEQAMAQPGPALHATASLAPIFKDSDWAAARARRNRICNEQSPDSALGRKKGAESYHQNVLNDAIRRADMEFVQGRDGTQIGGVKMHPKDDPDLTIGFGTPGAADRKGAGSNVQMQLDF